MGKFLPTLLGFVLLLSSCSVYDSVFHPHRLGTPPMSAAAKAKAKAAEKARHQGLTLKKEEPITDGASAADPVAPTEPAAPAAASNPPPDKPKTLSYSELPQGTKLTYNKQGLLKKSKLDRIAIDRRSLHHYDTHPLAPRDASRENRRLRKHGSKGKGRDKDSPTRDAPTRPTASEDPRSAPAPAPQRAPPQPAAKPVKAAPPEKVKATKPEKVKVEKPQKFKVEKVKGDKKTKKAPIPKPDPTQPQPFKGDQ